MYSVIILKYKKDPNARLVGQKHPIIDLSVQIVNRQNILETHQKETGTKSKVPQVNDWAGPDGKALLILNFLVMC